MLTGFVILIWLMSGLISVYMLARLDIDQTNNTSVIIVVFGPFIFAALCFYFVVSFLFYVFDTFKLVIQRVRQLGYKHKNNVIKPIDIISGIIILLLASALIFFYLFLISF